MKIFSNYSAYGVAVGVSLFAASVSTSFASSPVISLSVDGGGSWDWTPTGYSQGAQGGWQLDSPAFYSAGSSEVEVRELSYDVDPIVFNHILIQNNSAGPQTYTVTVTLPTSFVAPNLMDGSIDTSVIGFDSVISAPPGNSIYTALVDGVTVRTLQDDPFALGTSLSATSDYQSFANEVNALAVTSDMAIKLHFTLSPDDTASILSHFQIVPEPTSGALLLFGSSLLLWNRRRS